MARRAKENPPHRRPETAVERDARLYRLGHGLPTDLPGETGPAFDEYVAEKVALIQRDWDETTMILRSLGITHTPRGISTKALLAQLRNAATDRLLRFARIFQVDRELFEFSDWLPTIVDEQLAPDEFSVEVEAAIAGYGWGRSIEKWSADDGPPPFPGAEPVGPALVWREGGEWMYSPYKLDAPLHAMSAYEYTDQAGGKVLRVSGGATDQFVHGARRAYRNLPWEKPTATDRKTD
jgi:hypothetical protein